MQKTGIMERVDGFLKRANALRWKYMDERFPTLDRGEIVLTGGTRYLKIQVREMNGGSIANPKERFSAFCFIDVTNGDVLKPATWKAPAKHARGNVFNDDYGMENINPYGVNYMDTKGRIQKGVWS